MQLVMLDFWDFALFVKNGNGKNAGIENIEKMIINGIDEFVAEPIK